MHSSPFTEREPCAPLSKEVIAAESRSKLEKLLFAADNNCIFGLHDACGALDFGPSNNCHHPSFAHHHIWIASLLSCEILFRCDDTFESGKWEWEALLCNVQAVLSYLEHATREIYRPSCRGRFRQRRGSPNGSLLTWANQESIHNIYTMSFLYTWLHSYVCSLRLSWAPFTTQQQQLARSRFVLHTYIQVLINNTHISYISIYYS